MKVNKISMPLFKGKLREANKEQEQKPVIEEKPVAGVAIIIKPIDVPNKDGKLDIKA